MTFLTHGTPKKARILFMHGAGAPMDSEFMNDMTLALASDDIQIIRFEFPYMANRRVTGKKAPPPKAEKLIDDCLEVIARYDDVPLFLMGKSMGGRIASMVLEQTSAIAAFALGYPFHPSGKPDKLRISHFESMSKPMVVMQGTRDPLGNKEEVEDYCLPEIVTVHWFADGNHDLKPRVASGCTQRQHLEQAAVLIRSEIRKLLAD